MRMHYLSSFGIEKKLTKMKTERHFTYHNVFSSFLSANSKLHKIKVVFWRAMLMWAADFKSSHDVYSEIFGFSIYKYDLYIFQLSILSISRRRRRCCNVSWTFCFDCICLTTKDISRILISTFFLVLLQTANISMFWSEITTNVLPLWKYFFKQMFEKWDNIGMIRIGKRLWSHKSLIFFRNVSKCFSKFFSWRSIYICIYLYIYKMFCFYFKSRRSFLLYFENNNVRNVL